MENFSHPLFTICGSPFATTNPSQQYHLRSNTLPSNALPPAPRAKTGPQAAHPRASQHTYFITLQCADRAQKPWALPRIYAEIAACVCPLSIVATQARPVVSAQALAGTGVRNVCASSLAHGIFKGIPDQSLPLKNILALTPRKSAARRNVAWVLSKIAIRGRLAIEMCSISKPI